jgi:DNA ligase (NAD+)
MKKEIKELIEKLDIYDDSYYNKNEKLVTDEVYDGIKDKLRNLSQQWNAESKSDDRLSIKIKDALTRVGAPPPIDGKWNKATHEVPMGSLNKVNFPEEMKEWWNKCGCPKQLLDTHKLDGISISLKYESGNFVMAVTRGDGETGEDITRNVKKMKGVPQKLKEEFTGYIRGEIVLLHNDWKKHLSHMANPRNAASGIAKRIDGNQSELLTVISYTIEGADFSKEDEAFDYIESLGFIIPDYAILTIDEVIDNWKEYMNSIRATLNYDIDGKVIRVNDRAEQFSLGEEGGRPKGAIAFKFDAPEALTTIRDIICQVGDTGHITPVAEFDEVELVGAKIKRASLHNFSNIKTLEINIGAEVVVTRANDVIPFIKKVSKKNNGSFDIPLNCPSCGYSTIKNGEYLICPNKKSCQPQIIGRINRWIKENKIMEWGESILTKLVESGKILDIADLYKLTVNDISSLDRMGDKSASNLIDELNKNKEITLENFIGSLNIEGTGSTLVKILIDAGYNTLDKINTITISQLENIPGFGEKRAKIFYDGMIENKDRINDILNSGVSIKERITGKLTGKIFVFTGTMNTPRAQLQKLVEESGGEVKKSVVKGCTYLVISDPNSTSSKAKAALKLGIKLISEEEFLNMI